MAYFVKLFVLTLIIISSIKLAYADLVTDISNRRIQITSTFTGANLLMFGTFTEAFEYDPELHDIVITVRGPNQEAVLRKKHQVGGIWMNLYQEYYRKVPSYYSVLSSRNLEEISDKPTLGKLGLGTNFLFFSPDDLKQRIPSPQAWQEFRDNLVRLKKEEKLYIDRPNGVKFVGNGLFRANVDFPANVEVGEYVVSAYLFRDGKMIFDEHSPIRMSKSGFSNELAQFAKNYPWSHGVVAVLFALFCGWLASVVFRKN